jgi:AcrR family transcriptional regulator
MRSNPRTFTERARRAQIVECAIETVAELGYAQTSIRKIAERVGVAMSVVLYHFTNKEELVRAIVIESYQNVIAAVVPAIKAETSATDKLRAYITANARFLQSHRLQYMAVLDIGLSFRTASGGRLDQLEIDPELLGDLATLDLETILRTGQENGEFRTFDTRRMAVAIRSALNGAVLETSQDPDFDVLGYGEQLVTIFDSATRRK